MMGLLLGWYSRPCKDKLSRFAPRIYLMPYCIPNFWKFLPLINHQRGLSSQGPWHIYLKHLLGIEQNVPAG